MHLHRARCERGPKRVVFHVVCNRATSVVRAITVIRHPGRIEAFSDLKFGFANLAQNHRAVIESPWLEARSVYRMTCFVVTVRLTRVLCTYMKYLVFIFGSEGA